MDCIVANCQADCLGRCRRWILDPTIELDTNPKSPPNAWVSPYLRRPKRSYKNYAAERRLAKSIAKATA
jgi:hypothetical protein